MVWTACQRRVWLLFARGQGRGFLDKLLRAEWNGNANTIYLFYYCIIFTNFKNIGYRYWIGGHRAISSTATEHSLQNIRTLVDEIGIWPMVWLDCRISVRGNLVAWQPVSPTVLWASTHITQFSCWVSLETDPRSAQESFLQRGD